MLAGGNLVRQFLVASRCRDTLLDLTGSAAQEGSLFPATLTRQMRPFCNQQARIGVSAAGAAGQVGAAGTAGQGVPRGGRQLLLFTLHSLRMGHWGALLRWSGCLLASRACSVLWL
jgi:hypothetical protein